MRHDWPMSHTVALWYGCSVYVSCHPTTGIAHTRIVEARGTACPVRRHEIGARLGLGEVLSDPRAVHAANPRLSGPFGMSFAGDTQPGRPTGDDRPEVSDRRT